MKAVMYHYVRSHERTYPHFRYLDVSDFDKQLDYLEREFGFIAQDDFIRCVDSGSSRPGVVLTFDDGFKDHFEHVLPLLRRRGLWGLFYVPTAPVTTGRLLDVHRVHLLLGRQGGKVLARAIRELVTETMLSDAHVQEFHDQPYRRQSNDASTAEVKRLLNYFISPAHRQIVIDELCERFLPDESLAAQRLYMSAEELRLMQDAGMLLGSHTVHHPVLSRLAPEEQEAEIVKSFEALDAVAGGLRLKTFCYPYGGAHTFTSDTEQILHAYGCRFSFSLDSRDVTDADLSTRRQALPRYDCNEFEHGSARIESYRRQLGRS